MTNTIAAGKTLPVSVIWLDALDTPIVPTATSTWVSGTPGDLSVVSTGQLSASVTGINANAGVVVTATEPGSGATANITIAVTANTSLWISDSLSPGAVSSLDTGRIGYIVAWGGTEFGYAYTYALVGAPSALSIDTDTGVMSLSTTLSAGTYSFTIVATNRENTSLSASFPYTLTVLTGTSTSGTPTNTGHVWHKTYDPGSGTWGAPSGNDWTSVFNSMAATIISDQTAAGDGLLRANIPLQRATEYDYTNNGWLTGIQYFNVHDAGAGALPIMKCTSTSSADADKGPLDIGWAGTALMNPAGGQKNHAAAFATNAVGDSTITLLTASDASRIKVGRWHLIASQCIQIGGYPPNCMWTEYVRVTAVSGSTVTLDRKLHYSHQQDFYENTSDDQSWGKARIIPWDTGGTGGLTPADPRSGYRCSFTNIQFAKNPNFSALVASIHQTQGFIDLTYDGCGCLSPNPTILKHIMFLNSTIAATGEFDKLSEMAVVDGCVSGAFNGTQDYSSATGYMYVLYRNSHVAPLIMSPRQWRIMGGSKIDAQGDGFLFVPISWSYNGAILQFTVENSTLQGSSGTPAWAFAQNPLVGTGTTMGFTIGTDCTWGSGSAPSATTLIFPKSTTGNSQFENALVKVFQGMVVSSDNGHTPTTANYGYISKVYGPADSSAMWLDITWVNGTKPTSGTIWLHRWRKMKWTNVTLGTSGVTTTYNDAGFESTTAPGHTSYGFPSGLPVKYQNNLPLPPQTFDVTANFNSVTAGPFTTANKLLAWGNMPASSIYSNPAPAAISLFDGDPTGTFSSILAGGGKTGGNCVQMRYPAGVAGEGNKYYQIQCGLIGGPVNVEFDVLFETGFDFATPVENKIAPQIVWGGRTGANGGIEQFSIANFSSGSAKFSPILQNQQSPSSYPSEFISPAFNTAAINTNQWYHWKYRLIGGPAGVCQHYLDGVLLGTTVTTFGNSTLNDSVIYEFGWWSGGTVGPSVDGFVRMDNVHIYTG